MMQKDNKLITFQNKKIRRSWDEKTEKWYFSIVDIVQVLTDSTNPTDYLKKLRKRDKELAKYIGTNCPQVEMFTETGKKRRTLAGNPEHLLRLIQSIPSKKAEPIKLWLAKVGYERIQETTDPEKSINRGRKNWQRMGRNEKWIQQRMMGQEIRNKLTDYWKDNKVKEQNEYAILTNIIHQEWSDLKKKLIKEGYSEVSEKIGQLKLEAPDGKVRKMKTESRNSMSLLEGLATPSFPVGVGARLPTSIN